MGKRLLSTLLAVCMVLSLASTAFAADFTGSAKITELVCNIGKRVDTVAAGTTIDDGDSNKAFQLKLNAWNADDARNTLETAVESTDVFDKEYTYELDDIYQIEAGGATRYIGTPIENGKWVVRNIDNDGYEIPGSEEKGYLVTLYPEIIGKVTLKYNSQVVTPKVSGTAVAEDAVYGISGADMTLHFLNSSNTLDSTAYSSVGDAALAGYKFVGWYTVPQDGNETAEDKFADTLNNVTDLANLCAKQDDLSVTLYAHYEHIHTWKYNTQSLSGQNNTGTAYLYCTNDNGDAFHQCEYGATDDTKTTAKLSVTTNANNVSWTGDEYDNTNYSYQWYNNGTAIAVEGEGGLKEIVGESNFASGDSWVFTIVTGEDTTTTDYSGATGSGKAPKNIGKYTAKYIPFVINENPTAGTSYVKAGGAPYGVFFNINEGVQNVPVTMDDYDYSTDVDATVPTPTYGNIALVGKEVADTDVKLYYASSADYNGTDAVAVNDDGTPVEAYWMPWSTDTKADALPVGKYYMLLTLPKTEHYAAYASKDEFTVGGADIVNEGDGANVTVTVSGDDDNDNKVTYDGQNHGIVVAAKTGDALAVAENRAVAYKATENGEYGSTSPEYKDAGTYTVYYKVSADGYKTLEDSLTFTIEPKTLYAVATAEDKVYDGNKDATLTVKLYTDADCTEEWTGLTVAEGETELLDVTIPAKFVQSNVKLGTNNEPANITINADILSADVAESTKATSTTDPDNYNILYTAVEGAKLEATITPITATFSWSVANELNGSVKTTDYVLPYNGYAYTLTAEVSNVPEHCDDDANNEFDIRYQDGGNENNEDVVRSATENGSYRARVKYLGNDNYVLPDTWAAKTQRYSIKYESGNAFEAVISGTKVPTDNEWYKSTVTLTAPTGWKISASGKDGTWTKSIEMVDEGRLKTTSYYLKRDVDNVKSSIIEITPARNINIDYTEPQILSIEFKENTFKSIAKNLTFNHFFTDNFDITITASDDDTTDNLTGREVSGIATIEYKIIEKNLTSGEWPTNESIEAMEWSTYYDASTDITTKPSINANKSFYVMARATDKAGNVSQTVIYTDDSTVRYTQATKDGTAEFTKLNTTDPVSNVNTSDNTLKSAKLYDLSKTNDEGTDLTPLGDWLYIDNQTVKLKANKIQTLVAGEYKIVVSYDPNGEPFNKQDDLSIAPIDSTIILTVNKKENNKTLGAPEADPENPATTSTITLKKVDDLTVEETDKTYITSETFKVEYSCDGGKTWQDSPVFTGLSSGTTYNFVQRYKATDDGNYAASEQSTVTQLSTVAVKRSSSRGGGSSATYYTLTVTAGAGGTADVGKVSVRSGRSKTINFTPNAGYVVADVVVNGKSVGARAAYTLTNITKDTTVKVTFTQSANSVIVSTPTVINPSTGAGI